VGASFERVLQGWYEQLLERAKAHYVHDNQRDLKEL
jgi:hypothetical protein